MHSAQAVSKMSDPVILFSAPFELNITFFACSMVVQLLFKQAIIIRGNTTTIDIWINNSTFIVIFQILATSRNCHNYLKQNLPGTYFF
jgi:hypothetical protein